MKVDIGYWWPFARTAWGWTVATAGGLAALYHGPKAMFETFDWYMDRLFDHKVKDYLDTQIVRGSNTLPGGGRDQKANSKSIAEISAAVDYSEKRVRGCLKRLKRKKAVTSDQNNQWKADVPPVCGL
jgi:hypothetical protein